jgi:orotate phosphoribosyltransferase
MNNLKTMNAEELLALRPEDLISALSTEEILHIFAQLGGFWAYDYAAAREGRAGMHALLKSLNHSDGFVNSRVVLPNDNICKIMARQLVNRWREHELPKPDKIIGIPDGATKLGEHVGKILGVKIAKMEKVDGRIRLVTDIKAGESVLFVEDFCTKGTGFKEAVLAVYANQPEAVFIPYELVIINRGGLDKIEVGNVGTFAIIAAATHRINDWSPAECPLCRNFHSMPIKPKVDNESWRKLTESQL